MHAANRPVVSVVMSFFNAGATLGRALRSLQLQNFPHWELLLFDDGSTDDGAAVVAALSDPRIRLMRDGIRRGLPARLNQGIAQAYGMYIARIDADDVAFPERLSRQLDYLNRQPQVDLLATSALLVDAEDGVLGVLPAGLSHEAICSRPWQGFPMPHPTWMGRTDWFRQNPYDEAATKAQDQVLLYKTYRTSRFAGLPDVLLGYRYPGLSVRKTLVGRYHYLRSVASVDTRHALRGGLTHGAAALRDLAALATGTGQVVIRRRATPADAPTLASWNDLNHRLTQGMSVEGSR